MILSLLGLKGPDIDITGVPREEVMRVLKNRRRALVVQILSENGSGMSLSDLAESVGRIENGKEHLTSDERKRSYVALYQTHLSVLEDAGAVKLPDEGSMVYLGENTHDFARAYDEVGDWLDDET